MFSESTAAKRPLRTSYNTRFDGQKVDLDVNPQFVRRRLLANLGAGAGWLRGKLCRDPRLYREERFLEAAFQAEDPVHCPSEVVASARADWLRVFEVEARESSGAGYQLKVCVPTPFPLKVAGLIAA